MSASRYALPVRALPIALVSLLTFGSVGCDLLQPKVSQKEMESALADWLESHDLVATDIHCPDNQKMEKGNVFECTCKVHDQEIPVSVEVTDPGTGTVEWKPKYLTMKGEELAKEIKGKPEFAGHDVTVTCSDKVFVSVPDSEWTCDVVDNNDGGKAFVATLKFNDGEGNHNWSMAPKE